MRTSFSSLTGCAHTRYGWKGATHRRTPIVTRTRNDTCRTDLTVFWLMLLLGAFHGLKPGMGWVFAVALGMQEQKGSAVARSLVPIAVGHAAAIGCVVLTTAFLGMTLPLIVIRYFVAAVMVGLGIYCLVRHRHPRWVRMQVGFRDLTVWSFLMASAHGAGLMVVPVLLGSNTVEAHGRIAGHNYISPTASPLAGMLATGVH